MAPYRRPLASLGLAAGLTGLSGAAVAADATPAVDSPMAAIVQGKLILEIRARYEDVDQANLANDAQAFSVRTRLGWQTASWQGLQALVEMENVFHLDDSHYNVAVPGGTSLNGRTQYPIINDPSVTELNRAQLTWTASPHLSLTAGRQRILIDDQRFVGNVGWRQDEQTFDAVRADAHLGGFQATYAYVFHVNRIFGQSLDWRSDSHLVNASYTVSPRLKLEGFVYALDFGNAATSSTLTRGLRLSGKAPAGPLKLTYDATWARQGAYGDNPARFGLDYWQASATATWKIASVRADYEQLDGNGTRGFITPLATTHGFQGWADAWAAVGGNKTAVDGLKDVNVSLALRPPVKLPLLRDPELLVRRYDFWAARTGAKLAGEWDAQIQAAVTPRLTCAVKYAAFDRESVVPAGTALAPPSRTKVWLTFDFKL
ncbi:alginate export family protein [Caulobacter sp. KR2-114]|uniref:alginate export family protein n=1 Tax=Caulobacter sp. KR2-114 TaxID=3400912 RepID=UPI003C07658D